MPSFITTLNSRNPADPCSRPSDPSGTLADVSAPSVAFEDSPGSGSAGSGDDGVDYRGPPPVVGGSSAESFLPLVGLSVVSLDYLEASGLARMSTPHRPISVPLLLRPPLPSDASGKGILRSHSSHSSCGVGNPFSVSGIAWNLWMVSDFCAPDSDSKTAPRDGAV